MSTTTASASPDPVVNSAPDGPRNVSAPAARPLTRAQATVALLFATLTLVALLAARLGWRLHSMTTPSMGTTAPVGSTVITSPVSINDVHIGDIISFHPPGRRATSFVHRVVAIHRLHGQLTLRTKGDINGSVDGWTLTGGNLTGRARLVVPDLAFLIQMLPLLVLGTLLIALLTHGTRRDRRGPARLGLFSLLCSFLIYHFQPLSQLDLLTQSISNGHGSATVVTTGALPLRVTATGGSHADLAPGQLGILTRTHVPTSGHFSIHSAIHLTGWWWLLILAWLLPLGLSLRFSRPAPTGAPAL